MCNNRHHVFIDTDGSNILALMLQRFYVIALLPHDLQLNHMMSILQGPKALE